MYLLLTEHDWRHRCELNMKNCNQSDDHLLIVYYMWFYLVFGHWPLEMELKVSQ
jgi:hypothetical protein